MDSLNIFKNEQEYAKAMAEHPEIFFDGPTVSWITTTPEDKTSGDCHIEPIVTGKTGYPDAEGLSYIGWGGNDVKRLYKDLDEYTKVSQYDKDFVDKGYDNTHLNLDTYYCPMLDTSNKSDLSVFVGNLPNLISVPQFDTRNATDMSSMLYLNPKLVSVPKFDTSKVTNMRQMFYACSSLTSVPLFDTKNVKDMQSMFNGCNNLTTVPQFDMSNVYNTSYMFKDCSNLTNIGGFKGLTIGINVNQCPLTHDSLINILSSVGTLEGYNIGMYELGLGNENLAKLTDSEKKIATDKGWKLVNYTNTTVVVDDPV